MKFQNIKLYSLKDYLEIQTLKEVRQKINKKNMEYSEKETLEKIIERAVDKAFEKNCKNLNNAWMYSFFMISGIFVLMFLFLTITSLGTN